MQPLFWLFRTIAAAGVRAETAVCAADGKLIGRNLVPERYANRCFG
jgi:hypothetical protein